jgi:O-antigen/teichoic acid export membrane protein
VPTNEAEPLFAASHGPKHMKDLKEKTLRGGLAKACATAANFILRLGSLMIMARLLSPQDFGLVGMVTAVTGVLNLFRDFGLSAAAVQRASVSESQMSTLFWINIAVGGLLTLLLSAVAPAFAVFYREPRLVWIMVAVAGGFILNAAGVQHSSLLQRQMRFTTLATIDTIALVVSIAVGISMAINGYGYWALVSMALCPTIVSTTGLWLATGWVPGPPRSGVGLRSMMRFGGTMTLNGLVVYVAYNLEKVLLGRFWGAEAVGIYGRAFQIVSIPTDNLNSAVGEVAFSALSRVQDDPQRFRSYFLKGYSLVLGLSIPLTVMCTLFADDVIAVLLGPKWQAAAIIFRLLAPTILILAMINPLAWVMFSLGMVGRSLKVALVLSPVVISGYLIGLPYGPKGVAIGYSAAMAIWVVPHIAWCVHGTPISLSDVWRVVRGPLTASAVAGALAFAVRSAVSTSVPLPVLLGLEGATLATTYVVIILWVMGQKRFYMDLLRSLRNTAPVAVGAASAD